MARVRSGCQNIVAWWREIHAAVQCLLKSHRPVQHCTYPLCLCLPPSRATVDAPYIASLCRHPTIPDLWKFAARKDDIIVMLNGEKADPIPIEDALKVNPEVATAPVPVAIIAAAPEESESPRTRTPKRVRFALPEPEEPKAPELVVQIP